MSFAASEEKNNIYKAFFSELESKLISSNDVFNTYVRKFLELNENFTIQQNLAILNYFESKSAGEALVIHKSKNSINEKFKFIKLVLNIFKIITTTEYEKFMRKKNTKIEGIMNTLMLYSVIRSSQQFNLFKLNYGEDYKILNNEMFKDEINVIEL